MWTKLRSTVYCCGYSITFISLSLGLWFWFKGDKMAVLNLNVLLYFANLTGGWSFSPAVPITSNLNVNMDAAAANRVQRVGR